MRKRLLHRAMPPVLVAVALLAAAAAWRFFSSDGERDAAERQRAAGVEFNADFTILVIIPVLDTGIYHLKDVRVKPEHDT